MPQYVVFTLRAPMQSWGTSAAVGEIRSSASHPGRSGIIGVISACLGLRREDREQLQKLHANARVAVRMDVSGNRLRDYHTVQFPPSAAKVVYNTRREEVMDKVYKNKLSTMLSRREYLCNAVFTVCVWMDGEAGQSLKSIGEAMRKPVFTPYLGRKSCPLGHPLLPHVVTADNVADAFAEYDTVVRKEQGYTGKTGRTVWSDEGHGVENVAYTQCEVRDVLTESVKRQFASRPELRFSLPPRTEDCDVSEQSRD